MTYKRPPRNGEGRPPKFKTVKEMQVKIDAYFASCWEEDEDGNKNQKIPYTITGLALALDTDRELLLDYGNKDEFSDAIKKAKLKCHNFAEQHLFSGKNATGAIFNLKNNWGWKDETTANLNGNNIAPQILIFSNEDPLKKHLDSSE